MTQAHKELFNWFMDEPLLDDLDEELEDIHGFPIKEEEE